MKTPILIAEDDRVSRIALQRILERAGYEVQVTADGEAAWEALDRPDAPRLVILDWMMPGIDGLEVCRCLRAAQLDHYTYVMMLTVRDQRADLLAGLAGGADDYLTKPFDRDELLARLQMGRRILDLQEQLLATRERLRREATRDALTGAWNRRAGEDALRRELARAARLGEPLAVVLADIDRFKRINDLYGHGAGDAVLQEVSARLAAGVRQGDLVARWGGEELLVVLPLADIGAALEVAERLRATIAGTPAATPAGPVPVTASFGVAVTRQPASTSWEELLNQADERLYLAKANGRDRVEGPSPLAARVSSLLAAHRLIPSDSVQ